jgi:hypothetical protein
MLVKQMVRPLPHQAAVILGLKSINVWSFQTMLASIGSSTI